MLISLLFVSAIPVLVRCDGTILNDQFTIEADSLSFNNHIVDLKSGDTISIKLDVSQGTINFKIEDPMAHFLLDKEGIGAEGWQGQWTVPNDARAKRSSETEETRHISTMKHAWLCSIVLCCDRTFFYTLV